MVQIKEQLDKMLYQCEDCGYYYDDMSWAEECEMWCKNHDSCNVDITRHAITED